MGNLVVLYQTTRNDLALKLQIMETYIPEEVRKDNIAFKLIQQLLETTQIDRDKQDCLASKPTQELDDDHYLLNLIRDTVKLLTDNASLLHDFFTAFDNQALWPMLTMLFEPLLSFMTLAAHTNGSQITNDDSLLSDDNMPRRIVFTEKAREVYRRYYLMGDGELFQGVAPKSHRQARAAESFGSHHLYFNPIDYQRKVKSPFPSQEHLPLISEASCDDRGDSGLTDGLRNQLFKQFNSRGLSADKLRALLRCYLNDISCRHLIESVAGQTLMPAMPGIQFVDPMGGSPLAKAPNYGIFEWQQNIDLDTGTIHINANHYVCYTADSFPMFGYRLDVESKCVALCGTETVDKIKSQLELLSEVDAGLTQDENQRRLQCLKEYKTRTQEVQQLEVRLSELASKQASLQSSSDALYAQINEASDNETQVTLTAKKSMIDAELQLLQDLPKQINSLEERLVALQDTLKQFATVMTERNLAEHALMDELIARHQRCPVGETPESNQARKAWLKQTLLQSANHYRQMYRHFLELFHAKWLPMVEFEMQLAFKQKPSSTLVTFELPHLNLVLHHPDIEFTGIPRRAEALSTIAPNLRLVTLQPNGNQLDKPAEAIAGQSAQTTPFWRGFSMMGLLR